MQQDDFRALLGTAGSSGSSARYNESSFGSRRPAPKASSSRDALSLQPRSHGAKHKAPSATRSSTTAGNTPASSSSLRVENGPRLGIEKMLDILRETNPDMTEEQLRQLAGEGGPRGLDLSYIAQAKKQEADRQTAQAESALDEMLDEPHEQEAAPKKRSRDELLKSLREKQGSAPTQAPPESKPSKFRRVGDQTKPVPAAAAPPAADQPKKKKVKKRKVQTESAQEQNVTEIRAKAAQVVDSTPTMTTPHAPESTTEKSAKMAQEDDEEDADIFAGEADYSGLSDSDSDDARATKKPTHRENSNDKDEKPVIKKNNATWFDDDQTEDAEAISAPAVPQPSAAKAAAAAPSGDHSDEEYAQQRSEIRAMLDADKAAERDEKRKERKLKYREKAGLGNRENGMEVDSGSRKKEKKLTDTDSGGTNIWVPAMNAQKDKLNRDYQQLQSRMQNKDKS